MSAYHPPAMPLTLRLATRSSPLALWQARLVAGGLRRSWPHLRVILVPVISQGDRDQVSPLYGMGGVGVFASEVQSAVLSGAADAGIHSLKDLPTAGPSGLAIVAYLRRHDPRDALIGATSLAALPPQARIASSSLRRRSQLACLRPDLQFVEIRGNVQTRLRRLREGAADATLLAMAGLGRLGLLRQARARALDPWSECIPAPGQGIIAVECRSDDHRSGVLFGALDHRESRIAATIERTVLAGLRGGCSLPLGCFAQRQAGRWVASARLIDHGQIYCSRQQGSAADLGQRLLDEIIHMQASQS